MPEGAGKQGGTGLHTRGRDIPHGHSDCTNNTAPYGQSRVPARAQQRRQHTGMVTQGFANTKRGWCGSAPPQLQGVDLTSQATTATLPHSCHVAATGGKCHRLYREHRASLERERQGVGPAAAAATRVTPQRHASWGWVARCCRGSAGVGRAHGDDGACPRVEPPKARHTARAAVQHTLVPSGHVLHNQLQWRRTQGAARSTGLWTGASSTWVSQGSHVQVEQTTPHSLPSTFAGAESSHSYTHTNTLTHALHAQRTSRPFVRVEMWDPFR